MADCADITDAVIEAVVAAGRAKVERDAINSRLHPIVIDFEGERCGVCHWCESYITPGHLFCEKDPNDDGKSCSEMLEHEHKRRKDTGT